MNEFDPIDDVCCSSSNGSCGNCGGSLDDSVVDAGYGSTAGDDSRVPSDSPPRNNNGVSHVTKFLCPRYAKFSDAPSQKDSDVFAAGEENGEVQVESCGWEVQIFVDRKPE